ncbi:unnamed protein product [Rotaria sp. Silwood2]|nr:unnamed protein product [Rotaria sp. Silwood2]
MEASSLQSKNISTTQASTSNLTTSSTRSSLPSQQKITKKRKTTPKIVASDRRDINVRSQIGGHLCGIRHAGLVKLMGIMNLPSPIQDERYSKWDRDLLIIVKSFTGRSMKKAVEETVAAENGTELMVSGDGFWQTRGFQSRHGAAALFSCNTTPKVLDIETCSKTCALSIKKSNPAKYDNIIRSHRCEKSSGTMESAAILTMFKRSASKYGVYYTNKRMKRGLETIKREHGRKKLSGGKTIGGTSRLSVHNILRLQMTFASTIRKFKHDLDLLFNGSWAIFWHKYSTNDDPRHDYCSIDWCGYLKSVRDKTPYDHTSHALPRPVLDAIKPVFNNLCSRERKEIKKIEDLNHFSKRMKRGLETIKREHGRKKLSDGKTIGGKNRLSVHNILRLQMTFASTIRKFKHDLDLLFKGSWAIFWHKYSTNDDPRHDYCSIDWCGYLKSVRDKTPYDHTSHALPRPVLDAIKPVFNNLCSRESLTRVMDASTNGICCYSYYVQTISFKIWSLLY